MTADAPAAAASTAAPEDPPDAGPGFMAGSRLLAAAILIAAVLLRVADPWPVEGLRLRFFDVLQQAFPRAPDTFPVVIVDIDERSLDAHGQWPWPRNLLADLAQAVARGRPAAIGFDVLFVEPDRLSPENLARALDDPDPALVAALASAPSNDSQLAESFRTAPVVLGVAVADPSSPVTADAPGAPAPQRPIRGVDLIERGGDSRPFLTTFPRLIPNIAPLDAAARGRGVVSLDLAVDGVLRRMPAAVRVGESVYPALGVEVIRVAAGEDPLATETDAFGIEAFSVGGHWIPTDGGGGVWLHYAGHQPARFVSARDVLAGQVDPGKFAGKLVLVGATAAGLGDFVATPAARSMAGVEAHAELIEGVLAGATLWRPAWMPAVEIVILCGFGVVLVWLNPLRGLGRLFGLLILPAGLLVAVAVGAFLDQGLLLDPVYPILAAAVVLTVTLAQGFVSSERGRRRLAERTARVERDARERIELLLESTNEAIYGIDLEGRCGFFNSACVGLFGFSADRDLIGADMHALARVVDRDGLSDAGPCPIHQAALRGQRAVAADDLLRRQDGSTVAVERRAAPIWHEGRIVGAVVTCIDITERKAAAAALREREARLRQLQVEIDKISRVSVLGQVSSALAHELNQPLAAIMNYIPASRRILTTGNPDAPEKSADYLERAMQQARRAGDIIKGLRDLTRTGETARAPDDLNRVVEEACEIALLEHAERPLPLELDLAADLAPVEISRIQIEQIIVNLIRNGMEAMHGMTASGQDGGLTIATRRTDDGFAEVIVSDDGPGLAPEIRDRLFQPFVTSKSDGMGIGLSICRNIVTAHGGRIRAEDAESRRGLAIRFTLPFAEEDADEDGNAEADYRAAVSEEGAST